MSSTRDSQCRRVATFIYAAGNLLREYARAGMIVPHVSLVVEST